MPRYTLNAMVTISVIGTVEADSAAEALEMANDMEMPDLCIDCTRTHDPDDQEWDLDSVDGDAQDVTAELGDE